MAHKLTPDQQELVTANLGLAYGYARRSRPPAGMDSDEWEAECLYRLCKAAGSYEPSLGWKFSTYALRCLQSGWCHVATHRGRECRDWRRVTNLGEWDSFAVEPRPLLDPAQDSRKQLERLLATLPDKERAVLEGVVRGEILAQIGRKIGVTRERVRQIKVMAITRLGRYVAKLGLEYEGER